MASDDLYNAYYLSNITERRLPSPTAGILQQPNVKIEEGEIYESSAQDQAPMNTISNNFAPPKVHIPSVATVTLNAEYVKQLQADLADTKVKLQHAKDAV